MMQRFSSLCLVLVVLGGCAATRIGLETPAAAGLSEITIRGMGYDEKGLPVMGTPLAKRPSTPGDHFTAVRLIKDRPVVSYDIAVTRKKPDFGKPFQVVYEWTGKGFEWGLNASGVLANGIHQGTYTKDEAAAVLVIVFTPLAAGTVGGFVVGVVDGIRHAALEFGKVVVNADEQVITCTTYHYDSRDRLVLMRMLSANRKQELVRTEFVYEKFGTTPVRTIVKSLAEGKELDIR